MEEINKLERSPEKILQVLQDVLKANQDIWSVPLIEFIDQFYENLSNLPLDEDFDPKSINFTQAGLLIKNSSEVLARKVQLLWNQVMSVNGKADEPATQGRSKKKKNVQEWVVDDKLILIEDPEGGESTITETEIPRKEITTFPKIPFSLLQSLESREHDDSFSYRVNNVPDERHCVILLDSSQQLPNDLEEDKLFNDAVKQENSVQVERNEDVGGIGGHSDSDEAENVQPKDEQETDATENQTSPLDVDKPFVDGDPFTPPETLNSSEEGFVFSKRPFKKIKTFHIPQSFNEGKRKEKKNKLNAPWHPNLFGDAFQKLKQHRKQMLREEDRKTIDGLSISDGKELILPDIDLYVVSTDEEDLGNWGPDDWETPSIQPDIYQQRCQEAIQQWELQMKKERQIDQTAQVLADWEKEIGPLLELEKKRPEYDVKEVPKIISEKINLHLGKITFSALVEGLPVYQISRFFLSCLGMVNSGRIALEKFVDEDQRDDMFLILLEENSTRPE